MKISISYKKDERYKTSTISGVWGGIAPNGMIHCDFFMEKAHIPESTDIDINEKTGKVSDNVDEKQIKEYIRNIEFGMIVSVETAELIGHWLIDKANRAKKEKK